MKTDSMNEKKLELYIHIPFCVKKCDYCDFLSFPADSNTQIRYVHALLQEIRYYGNLLGDYHVPTIYIGGGTPSWLEENLIYTVLQQVTSSFHVEADAEISIECNPGTVTAKKLNVYQSAGINRLSIGLQSTNNEELKALGRIHTYDQFLKTYELARNAGFENINIDLMSGLPYQTLDKFLDSLQTVIRLKPEHISAYSLIIEKGTPFYERYKFDAVKQEAGIHTEILPEEDEVYRIYKATQDVLKQAGYRQYEISNFARPGYACRHNIGYWTRKNYLGLGLGASSLVENVRYTNTRQLYEYGELCDHLREKSPAEFFKDGEHAVPEELWIGSCVQEQAQILTRKEQMEEFMFLGLRMNEGVTRAAFEQSFGVPIEAVYLETLRKLKEQGLLQMVAGRIALTDKGMDLANYVMAKFLL